MAYWCCTGEFGKHTPKCKEYEKWFASLSGVDKVEEQIRHMTTYDEHYIGCNKPTPCPGFPEEKDVACLVKYIRELEAKRDRLKADREAAMLNWQAGLDEIDRLKSQLAAKVAEIAGLREGLRRLQYRWDHTGTELGSGTMYTNCCQAWIDCTVNEAKYPKCKPDCWLAALLEEPKDAQPNRSMPVLRREDL